MRNLRRFLSVLGCTVAVMAALGFVSRPPSLLNRATRHDSASARLTTTCYWWLTDHEIAAVTADYDLVRIDVTNGTSKPLPPILEKYKLLNAGGQHPAGTPQQELADVDYLYPSPNG